MSGAHKKQLEWVGASRDDLREFPKQVRCDVAYAILLAEKGLKSSSAKPLSGFGGAGVLEIIEDFRSSTYRVVYTVKFEKAVYVLHCFQKKSTKGIKTSERDIDLIKQRLRAAKLHYQANYT